MPIFLIGTGIGAVAAWWTKSATDNAMTGIQQGAKESTSNVLVIAAVVGVFLVGKNQKWW